MLSLQEISGYVQQEKISTDVYTNGDAVYFAWTNWRKPLERERLERQRSAKPWTSVSAAPSHGTQVASFW